MILRMNYKKVTAILSAKGDTFRFLLMGISKNEALEKLNNSVTYMIEEYCKYARIKQQLK